MNIHAISLTTLFVNDISFER